MDVHYDYIISGRGEHKVHKKEKGLRCLFRERDFGIFPSPIDIFLNVTSSTGGGGVENVGVQGSEET